MLKGIVIPVTDDAYIFPLPEKDALDVLQKQVGGNIEALPFPGRNDVTCYVNEEGKYTQQLNPGATLLMRDVLFDNDYIAGPLVICGFDPVTGEHTELPPEILEAMR